MKTEEQQAQELSKIDGWFGQCEKIDLIYSNDWWCSTPHGNVQQVIDNMSETERRLFPPPHKVVTVSWLDYNRWKYGLIDLTLDKINK